MKHFEKEQWVDFARGLVTEEQRADMSAHVAGGCTSCGRTAKVLRELAVMAEADAGYEPPAALVRRALAVYTPPREESGLGVGRVLAQLVWATFREPLPVGIRAGDRPIHALYHAAGFALDVHLSHEPQGDDQARPRTVLVGQIVEHGPRGRRMGGIPVRLVSRKRVAARAVTNELGEFHIECRHEGPLTLRLSVPRGKKTIEVRLPRVVRAGKR